jgi:hypothetical protein
VGIRADQLTVIDPALAVPRVPASMPQSVTDATSMSVAPYVLTAFMKNDSLPLISIEAAAPDAAGAKRLADAALALLASRAFRGGAFESQIATGAAVFRLQPFVVSQVAPVRVKTVPASVLPLKAIGASLFVLVVWTAGVLLMPRRSGPVRRRRSALAA